MISSQIDRDKTAALLLSSVSMSFIQYLLDLVAVFTNFFNLIFGSTPTITKVPNTLGLVTNEIDVAAPMAFFKTFPDIGKICFYCPSMTYADRTPLDLLIIHDPKASSNYLSVPDRVPREALPYAELIPVASLDNSALSRGLAAFSAKSQRFGR